MSSPLPRRASALAAATLVSVAGLAACGSHHKASAPTTASPTTPAPVAPGTTPTTARPKPKAGPVAPLTGLPVTAAVARRPAVVLKIDNLQAALPQTGVNQADVVYEELVEGGLTRLAAVFQSQQPTTVGPVRSGRLTDEGIADDLDHPVLAYAGANGLFQPVLAAQPVQDVDDDTNPDLFVRNNAQVAPHNLYTTIVGLAATDTGGHAPPALWAFHRAGAAFRGAGITRASGIAIGFPAAAVQWTWDAKTGSWLRTQNGVPDVDSTGARLSAANVIVQFVPYITSAVYGDGEGAALAGTPIPTGELVGSGVAWYLSDGSIVKGTWSRSSLTATTVYKDSAGRRIALAPGRTWVELPPVGTVPTVTP